jgi:broad specificity phosphatase PhoE
MRLILIRHGETEHNRGNITLGRADVPLNERGMRQARAIVASFHRPPAAIYTSPLDRCASIARAIGIATGCEPAIDPGLIEMDVGEMEHLTGAELRDRYPEFLRVWMADAAADARMPGGETLADARMPGGETLAEVQVRAWRAVESIAAAHGDGEVVSVTHNFVIRTLVCRVLGLPLARFRAFGLGVASRTVVDIGRRGPALVALNDTAHLRAAGLG